MNSYRLDSFQLRIRKLGKIYVPTKYEFNDNYEYGFDTLKVKFNKFIKDISYTTINAYFEYPHIAPSFCTLINGCPLEFEEYKIESPIKRRSKIFVIINSANLPLDIDINMSIIFNLRVFKREK